MSIQEIYDEGLAEKNTDDFDLKRWFNRVIRSWYWFVGSITLCLFAAWLYLHYKPPVYEAVAAVMIKDERKGGDISDNAVLKELGIGGNKSVENEIEILRSYDLMEEVVRREQLFVTYMVPGRIKDVAWFGSDLPFSMEVLNTDSISKVTNWLLAYKNNGLELTANGQVTSIKMGNPYFIDGVKFRMLPTEASGGKTSKLTDLVNPVAVTIMPVAAATGGYNSRLSVDLLNKQASVVSLGIEDIHEERAKVVLSSLINIYNRQGLDDKNKVTANTIDFLNDRLKAVASDLEGVEGQVQKFKSANQITDVSADAQQYMELSKDIDLQKAESQTKLNIVSALERDLLLNQDNPGLVPSTLGLGEVSLASLVEKHNALVLEREKLSKDPDYGPQHPDLVAIKEGVQETRRKLLANVRNLKEAFQIALNDIAGQDDQLKRRIKNIPLLEQKLVEIQRNRNVEEQLYAFLLQKREEAAVTLASNIPDSRTIIKARGLGKVSPKARTIWTLALIFGIFIPFGIMLLGDFLNNRVGDTAEVEQKTNIPLLGVISHIRKIKTPIVIASKSRSLAAEQIRSLRTALGFTGRGGEVKRIMVTSSQPADGKSFISINLAASYALLGKKTVLVELDLRKPHVAKYLGLKPAKGISDVLVGKEKVDNVLVEIPGFDSMLYLLLPSGYLPPNPAELISTAQMDQLMAGLAEKFDFIIIDTPPFGLVTDAVLLQKHADVTLAVLRQGHTHKDAYKLLNYRKKQRPDYPIYAVLNGVGKKKRYAESYGYGKYSTYNYGKGYFEGEEE
ncbi:MAG: hypothetical protein DI535_21215 [Citrobacter freundii]|nr:MAG: hypothetical protein DI535_21215 [Citrobacter freundii]